MYSNYQKFMAAADLTKKVEESFTSETMVDKLAELRARVNKVQERQQQVDDTLRPKLKQIRKLSSLETDLDKLRNLNAMPERL